jgi:hypothetical protein
MPRSLLVLTLAGSLFTLAPARAGAQNQAENVAAARALGIQGVQLADEGRCAEALGPLERAETLYHAPSILGRLGECQVAVGQLVLGTENLNRTVREPLAANAPQAFRDAQARAQKVLDSALPRIARLVVHVEPPNVNAKVLIGSTEVPPALLGAERPTDPGTHQITANAPGFLQSQSIVTLAEGARQEVTLTMTRDPNAVVPGVAPVAAAPRSEPPPPTLPPPALDSGRKSSTAGIVLLAIGGAGLAVGGVTGYLAIQKESDLDCPDHECPESEQDKLDQANSMAMISNIGFGVGIAGAIVGTVLLLSGGNSTEKAARAASLSSLRARPFVRGQSLGVEGSF